MRAPHEGANLRGLLIVEIVVAGDDGDGGVGQAGNCPYRAQELEYVLNQADITTLFLTDRFKSSDFEAILTHVCSELPTAKPGMLQSKTCPKLQRVISIKNGRLPGAWNWLQPVWATERNPPLAIPGRLPSRPGRLTQRGGADTRRH